MKHSSFENRLIKQISDQLPGASPGVMVQVYQNGRKVCDIAVGDTYAYYDLASLTKIVFTTQAMIQSFAEGKWNLKTRVQEIISWFPHPETTLVELLNHSSGLVWWMPLYKEFPDMHPAPEDFKARWARVQSLLIDQPLEKQEKSVYSDLGFITLAYVLENLYGKALIEIWHDIKEKFYPRLSLDFSVNNARLNEQRYYAPTEKCTWRGRVLQGEVHDENCWALGGVSTHAGLFGSIDDMGWFGLFIRGQLQGISRTLIKQKTAQLFASRSLPMGKGDWALGYMMPTPGQASSGDYFSPYSIGHTGFTGTSFWYDPAQDLVVAVLSNRVAFGREREAYKKLRPQIHNWIVEGLRRASL
jgi:CubicO group peptidase (beta-lactamase class C family)